MRDAAGGREIHDVWRLRAVGRALAARRRCLVSPCTVDELLAEPSLRLRPLVGPGSVMRNVQGVHVSDLANPYPYVLPGELLLTNGLWRSAADDETYVHQARAAGAVAIGYGLGVCRSVPHTLVDACRQLRVTLIEIPEDLSFSAVADFVAEQNRDQQGGARVRLMRLRRLLQQLARGEGYAAVLELLRRETRLPVWLAGPGGRSLTAEPVPDPAAARAAARAARRGAVPCALTPTMSAFGVADEFSTTVVIVGRALAEVDDDARLVIEQATWFLRMEDARVHEAAGARGTLAEHLVAELCDGEPASSVLDARLVAIGMRPDRELAVACTSNQERDVLYAQRACDAPCVVACWRGARIMIVQSESDTTVDELIETIRDGGEDPVVGVARATRGAEDLRRGIAEAVSAHELARTRPEGQRVVCDLAVATHQMLLEFVPPDIRKAYRESVLGPLERWDAEHEQQLVRTLQVFLRNDGQWRRSAAELNIHHNTLHYRIDRVAELTGRSLQASSSRADFAVALAIRPTR